MRTKTLLVAVAALAVGAITSQAQVYSQNIVGYVNKVIPLGQSLISNPLQGTTNDLEQLLNLQGGEVILLWTGSGYQVYEYQQGYVSNYGTPSDWTDGGGAAIPGTQVNWEGSGLNFVPDPQIAPGQGFFIQEGQSAFTNTFVGTVVLNSTNVISSGQSLISSALPVAGDLETNTTLNLPLFGGEILLIWTGSGYQIYEYQQGYVSNYGTPSDWTDGGGAAIPGTQVNWEGSGLNFVPDPQIAPGQAVFYQTQNATTNWVQNLVIQ